MDRTQFTFYESFFKAISRIKKDSDRGKAYDAICAYALYGTEPDLDKLPDSAAIAFELSKPNLDASRRKANSGKKGGEGKQTASKPEANRKQTASKKESKKENKKENKCYTPVVPFLEILSSAGFGESLNAAVSDWLSYKQEKRQPYKETGFKSLVAEIQNNAKIHGEDAVASLIRQCMAANWQGIIFDRLGKAQENPLNMAVPKNTKAPVTGESMAQYTVAFRKKVSDEQ